MNESQDARKLKLREELREQIKDFLDSGGEVQELPPAPVRSRIAFNKSMGYTSWMQQIEQTGSIEQEEILGELPREETKGEESTDS